MEDIRSLVGGPGVDEEPSEGYKLQTAPSPSHQLATPIVCGGQKQPNPMPKRTKKTAKSIQFSYSEIKNDPKSRNKSGVVCISHLI